MNNDFEEETGPFKLKMDGEIDETPTGANVDELRLEKISQRVTFISILIPVLIIIVLVIAYLDIKKRMTYSEDTGTMEFQKLSSDLESRFGTLSLNQAKLEESLVRFTKNQNQSMANSNVKFDQMKKKVDSLQRQFVTQKAFSQVRGDFDKKNEALGQQIDAVAHNVDQADQQIAQMTEELKIRIVQIGETLTARDQRLEELAQRIAAIDETKIDEQGLDLKLRLATLKVQQELKAELDALNQELKSLSNQVARLSAQKTAPPTPTPHPPNKVESKPVKQPSSGIKEEAIK
jgi:chromosome segregation ATPase